MKALIKLTMILVTCNLLLSSCKKETYKNKTNLLIGTWKTELISNTCSEIFTLTFKADSTLVSTCATIQNGKKEENEYNGIYMLDQSKKITIAIRQGEKAIVKTLTRNNTQLILADSDNFKEIGLIYVQVE